MQPQFWLDRWNSGQIGFHKAAVDPQLRQYWPDLELVDNSRVFVPLCGKSVDILWLLSRGHGVVGVEISMAAMESFCLENGIPARRRRIEHFDEYQAPNLCLFRGDFFSLTPQLLGTVTAIYDRAALISWSPEMRAAYVQHLTALTGCGAQTLLITLEYPQSEMHGPPFSVSAADVDGLYGRDHAIRELSRQDILASEPRLRARGVSRLHEVCYRLTRR